MTGMHYSRFFAPYLSALAATALALGVIVGPLHQPARALGAVDCGPQLQPTAYLPRAVVAPGVPANGSAAVPAQNSGDGDTAIFLTPQEIAQLRRNSACKRVVRQLVQLKNEIQKDGVSTRYYDLRLIPTDELIKDQQGSYYALYLKDARRRRRFRYRGGRYVIRRVNSRFRTALTRFVRDVLAKVHGGVEYQLYVRGSASSKPMRRKRRQTRSYPFETISYYPKVGQDLYDANQTREIKVERRYGNDALPYLRAAFLKQVVQNYFPLSEPAMLESTVAETRSRSAQYAEIILFIDWD